MGQIKVEKNVGGIEGLCVVTPAVHGDSRGYFMETYSQRDMEEAEFGDFLKLGLGHPELLIGNNAGKYSLHVTGNVRLILKPNDTGDTVMICEEVVMEGVVDYHGGKTTRYIP